MQPGSSRHGQGQLPPPSEVAAPARARRAPRARPRHRRALLGTAVGTARAARKFINDFKGNWRRRRDSNPRDGFPSTPLAGERLRPLGHVSTDGYSRTTDGNSSINSATCGAAEGVSQTPEKARKRTGMNRLWARFGQFAFWNMRAPCRGIVPSAWALESPCGTGSPGMIATPFPFRFPPLPGRTGLLRRKEGPARAQTMNRVADTAPEAPTAKVLTCSILPIRMNHKQTSVGIPRFRFPPKRFRFGVNCAVWASTLPA